MSLETNIRGLIEEADSLPPGIDGVRRRREIGKILGDIIPALGAALANNNTFDTEVICEA